MESYNSTLVFEHEHGLCADHGANGANDLMNVSLALNGS